MNSTNMLFVRLMWLHEQIDAGIRRGSTRESEEGSHTTDNLWWVIGVIAVAGLATAAVRAYTNGLIGQIG